MSSLGYLVSNTTKNYFGLGNYWSGWFKEKFLDNVKTMTLEELAGVIAENAAGNAAPLTKAERVVQSARLVDFIKNCEYNVTVLDEHEFYEWNDFKLASPKLNEKGSIYYDRV